MIKSNDIYTAVTQKIISDLEKGELTWRKPWNAANLAGNVMRPLRWNEIPYTGINTIMLWATAAEKGYISPYWMTYKQAFEMKAHVRKGEAGTQVVYADKFTKEETEADGKLTTQQINFLKSYTVFNASQIEGLPPAFYELPEKRINNKDQRIEEVDLFFKQTNAKIHTGTKAAYNALSDDIEMPPFECFNNAAGYYATLAHETTHWTKHSSRLNRDFNHNKFGDEDYAKEELVAELGACFLGADLGFEPITKENHAAYIQSWLKALKNDKRFIFQAASQAQKAVEFMIALQTTDKIKEQKPVPVLTIN